VLLNLIVDSDHDIVDARFTISSVLGAEGETAGGDDSVTFEGHGSNGAVYIMTSVGDDVINVFDIDHVFIVATAGSMAYATHSSSSSLFGLENQVISEITMSTIQPSANDDQGLIDDNDYVMAHSREHKVSATSPNIYRTHIIITGGSENEIASINAHRSIILGNHGTVTATLRTLRLSSADDNIASDYYVVANGGINRQWLMLPFTVESTIVANTINYITHHGADNGITAIFGSAGIITSEGTNGEVFVISQSGTCKQFIFGFFLFTMLVLLMIVTMDAQTNQSDWKRSIEFVGDANSLSSGSNDININELNATVVVITGPKSDTITVKNALLSVVIADGATNFAIRASTIMNASLSSIPSPLAHQLRTKQDM
jgi:hypothetical protein